MARSAEATSSAFAIDLEQPNASAYLGSLERGKIPPLLFTGPEGTGKELTAIEFARRLCCENVTPCRLDGRKCPSCLRAALLEHPGFHLVYPTPTQGAGEDEEGDVVDIAKVLDEKRRDVFSSYRFAKKASIRIARARAAIQRANTKPFDSPYHVFIFVDAHAMREEAQNALLKLVEEPPAHCVIIFITPNAEGLLYTIRSRCQEVRFFPLKRAVIERILTSYYGADASAARRAAALAQGSIARARALIEGADTGERDAALSLVEGLSKERESWALGQALVAARGANREGVARVLEEMAVILRDAMAGDAKLVINADVPKEIEKAAAVWDRARLPQAIDLVLETRSQIFSANANIDGALADLFLRLRRLR